MSDEKEKLRESASDAGTIIGNALSENAREATHAAVEGMDLFKAAAEAKKNVPFAQSKGNLFEYIEAAKFNEKAATIGEKTRAIVTEADGRPHAAADIELVKNGKVIREVQAKFSDSKNAASDSVGMQRSSKYKGMMRLIRKEEHYIDKATGEETTLLDKAKQLAKNRASKEGSVYQAENEDVYRNLEDELRTDTVSSGGTTLEELQAAHKSPEHYAQKVEHTAVAREMKTSAANMAKASFVTTGVISGITNMIQVFNDEKELAAALKDVGADAVESGIRGGATGVLSTAIRYYGIKAESALLSDATAATVMAGGMIDGGAALLSYAKGDIDAKDLRDRLVDTTAKSVTTIYFTKAVPAIIGGAVSPIATIVVYTTANFVTGCIREIVREAKLEAEEFDRLAAVYEASTAQIKEYRVKLEDVLHSCELHQRNMLEGFIESFDYNIASGENYDEALLTITEFANRIGLVLQYESFNDFSSAMRSKGTFRLG